MNEPNQKPDDLTEEQITELANEHAESCYEDDGEAAYGREDD